MPTLDRVQKVVVDTWDVSEDKVTPTASFKDDLGADSLARIELVMALEEEFNIDISDDDAEKILTVAEAVSYIEEKTRA